MVQWIPWIFVASQGELDSVLLQPAGQASTVAHRPPHSTTPTLGSTGGKGRETAEIKYIGSGTLGTRR